MSLRLHHVFAFVAPAPPAPPGLVESFRRAHPGQGTANVCYMLGETYLELLWETDRAEITNPAIVRTGLAERARWQDTGACPFGICLTRDTEPEALPFDTWDYIPPFLPPDMTIPVAVASQDPAQPFVFLPPTIGQPVTQYQDGLGGIIGLHLDCPPGFKPADDLRTLAELGVLTLGTGSTWHMVLTVARPNGGQPRHLALPDGIWVEEHPA
ncbi:MAG: hypothetical protein WCZ23_07590 [Rhodospirillaceae bacterium]